MDQPDQNLNPNPNAGDGLDGDQNSPENSDNEEEKQVSIIDSLTEEIGQLHGQLEALSEEFQAASAVVGLTRAQKKELMCVCVLYICVIVYVYD